MHPSYLSNLDSLGGVLARGALDGQLKELLDTYKLLCELVEKHSKGINKEKVKIFIAQMFLGGSYEVIKSFLGESRITTLRQTCPKFNFLYHCRNASFHGNRISFKYKNKNGSYKVEKAEWKNHKIDKNDQGKFLFTDKLNINEVDFLIKEVKKLF